MSNPIADQLRQIAEQARHLADQIEGRPTTGSGGVASPASIPGSQDVRELVARFKSFGSVSPYARRLFSAPASGLVNGNVADTIAAYSPGGIYGADGGYMLAHASPRDFGWTWNGATWLPPPGGDPLGMRWDGAHFV